MIPYENLIIAFKEGLRKYLKCDVIRTNQIAEAPPYPYVSYTVTTLMTANLGTYGEYEDGTARKPVTCIVSLTAQSDKSIESVMLANKARTWLDFAGAQYLQDKGVIVQSLGNVANRDNLLTVGYEYKNGFDCTFSVFDEVDIPDRGTIETADFQNVGTEI